MVHEEHNPIIHGEKKVCRLSRGAPYGPRNYGIWRAVLNRIVRGDNYATATVAIGRLG